MQMNNKKKNTLIALVVALCVSLTACGGKKEEAPAMPEFYAIGEDQFPSISKILQFGEEIQFLQIGDTEESGEDAEEESSSGSTSSSSTSSSSTSSSQVESEPVSYQYSGFEAGKQAAEAYIKVLQVSQDGTLMDELCATVETTDFSEASGVAYVGKPSVTEEGTFRLEVQWEDDTCTITPSIELPPPPKEMTQLSVEEAVSTLEEYSAQSLGLPKDSMDEYTVIAEDGLVLVDGTVSFKLDVYDSSTKQVAGSYMITLDGSHIYRLDPVSRTVELIS